MLFLHHKQMNCKQIGGLKTSKLSQLLSLEAGSLEASCQLAIVLRRLRGGSSPPRPGWWWPSTWTFSGLQLCHSDPFLLRHVAAFSLCGSVSLLLSGHSSHRIGVPPSSRMTSSQRHYTEDPMSKYGPLLKYWKLGLACIFWGTHLNP